jgi:hypothetical protein
MDAKQAELEISQIKRIMEESRGILIDDGTGFIVWGFLISTGLTLSYLSSRQILEWTVSSVAWILLIAAGWVYTLIQFRKEKKQSKAVTFAGRVSGAIWGSAGITMTIIGFAGSYSGMIGGSAISPLMACVIGLAYYVSGFGWWFGSVTMFFWRSPHTLLVFALMMLFMQVMPGIIMYKKWKKETAII